MVVHADRYSMTLPEKYSTAMSTTDWIFFFGQSVVRVCLLIPDLEKTLFWNGASLIWIFWHLPITEWGLPILEWGLYFFLSLESSTTRSQKRGMIPISERDCQYSPFKTGTPVSKCGHNH